MKTKHILIILSLISTLSVSCIREEMAKYINSSIELTARMEYEAETKTSLSALENGMYYPLWSAGDQIAVYADGDVDPSRFTLTTGEGTTIASFSGNRQGSDYLAVYPYEIAGKNEGGKISLTLPQIQTYVPDSFGQGAFPMIATGGSDGSLKFMNLCSVLKITLKGKTLIRSITVTANDEGTFLSGLATMADEYDGAPSVIMEEGGSHSVTLECKGVEVRGEEDFYIVIPAQTYINGLTIEIDAFTEVIIRKIESDILFERSQIRHLKNLELNQSLDEKQMRLAKEKAALISIYEALNGDEWLNNENWCSDRPLNEWYGVYVDKEGFVSSLALGDSSGNLNDIHTVGYIPDEILDLSGLKQLSINYARLSGNPLLTVSKIKGLEFLGLDQCNISCDFPEELCELTDLFYLSLHFNDIRGGIPDNIGNLNKLKYLWLGDNKNLSGHIPESIGKLSVLEGLELCFCGLSGTIPSSLGNLSELRILDLSNNQLTSEIPEDLSKLSKIEQLDLSWNRLTGQIPSWIATLKLRDLALCNNQLYGKLPMEFQNMDVWPYMWGFIVFQNDLDLSEVTIPAPDFDVIDIDGNNQVSEDIYRNNKCVIFIDWDPDIVEWEETISIDGKDKFLTELNRLYDLYSEQGLEIIGYCPEYASLEGIRSVVERYDIKWPIFQVRLGESIHPDNFFSFNGQVVSSRDYPLNAAPAVFAADADKKIGYYHDDYTANAKFKVKDYVNVQLGIEPEYYVSTDYTTDGVLVSLQSASVGNGINIVLMGDGYSDRQIADGTYRSDMEQAYRNLFTEEPYKSYQDMFNVNYVNVVSATEGYEYGDTALGCQFGEGTYVYGNDQKCFEYAQNVVAAEGIDETLVVVVMNSDAYAGTCFMYDPIDKSHDFGSGASVAYFPKGGDKATFAQLLHHEACGHGFAKLADEYYNEGLTISDAEIMQLKNQNTWGWWKNTDFTSDPSQVKWAKFLADERYASEGLGVFEGAHTYQFGVYRPTDESIMRYNTGGFNAPSREAIYYRIHKLAYGDDWEYDYEKFVEYDAINRVSAQSQSGTSSQKRRANYVEKQQKPLAPPVIVGRTWK